MKKHINIKQILGRARLFIITAFLLVMSNIAFAQLIAYEPNLSGRYEITATAGGSNALNYNVKLRKPAGATTAYKVFMYNASVFNRTTPPSVTVDGQSYSIPNLQTTVAANGTTFNGHSGPVAGALKTKLDAATAGTDLTFNIIEGTDVVSIDGVGLIVIWNNPTKLVGTHYVHIGMKMITLAGTTINVPVSPLDKNIPGFEPILGIGINYSVNTDPSQNAKITLNGGLLTANAGGADDSLDTPPQNGTLITLGGYGDDPVNNDSDELYNVAHLITNGVQNLQFVFTDVGGPDDDVVNAIYFSGVGVTPTPCNLLPPVTENPIFNNCPATTVNLNTQGHVGSYPSTAQLVWYTTPTRTAGSQVPDPTNAGAGIYYAFYYDASRDCYSAASNPVTVNITNCVTCSSGNNFVNLNSLYTGTHPDAPSTVIEWWTSPTRDLDPLNLGTKVTDPTHVTQSGTYYAFFYDTPHNCYNTNNSTAAVVVNILPPCYCTKPGDFSEVGTPTKMGISVQQKQTDWPENIPNGFMALESKEKGFVVTRVQNSTLIAEPKEGMLIYDIAGNCVKLYNGTTWKCITRSCND